MKIYGDRTKNKIIQFRYKNTIIHFVYVFEQTQAILSLT